MKNALTLCCESDIIYEVHQTNIEPEMLRYPAQARKRGLTKTERDGKLNEFAAEKP